MPESPLTDKEIRVLRGMIDEYQFAERRRLLWSQHYRAGSRAAMFMLGIALTVMQIVVAVLAIRGH